MLLSLVINMSAHPGPSSLVPLPVSAFAELGSAPEGKFLAIWGALAGQYCQVSTSLSPMGWSLSAFELASKYVSSP